MFRFFLLIWCAAFSFSSIAIVNIESLRLKLKEGVSGQVVLKGAGASGNSDNFRSSVSSTNAWNWSTSQLFFVSSYQYGESREVKDTNKFFAHLRYAKNTGSPRLQTEVYTQWQFNEFQRLNSRTLAGTGLRWSTWKNKYWQSFLGAGGFWYAEDIKKTDLGAANSEDGVRGNFYFTVAGNISSELTLFNTVYFQPLIDWMEDHNVLWELLLQQKLSKYFSFMVSWSLGHDNEPQSGTKSTDTSYMLGLTLKY